MFDSKLLAALAATAAAAGAGYVTKEAATLAFGDPSDDIKKERKRKKKAVKALNVLIKSQHKVLRKRASTIRNLEAELAEYKAKEEEAEEDQITDIELSKLVEALSETQKAMRELAKKSDSYMRKTNLLEQRLKQFVGSNGEEDEEDTDEEEVDTVALLKQVVDSMLNNSNQKNFLNNENPDDWVMNKALKSTVIKSSKSGKNLIEFKPLFIIDSEDNMFVNPQLDKSIIDGFNKNGYQALSDVILTRIEELLSKLRKAKEDGDRDNINLEVSSHIWLYVFFELLYVYGDDVINNRFSQSVMRRSINDLNSKLVGGTTGSTDEVNITYRLYQSAVAKIKNASKSNQTAATASTQASAPVAMAGPMAAS